VSRLHANSVPFSTGDLSVYDFGILHGLEPIPCGYQGMTVLKDKV
jgi:hypothetical protein